MKYQKKQSPSEEGPAACQRTNRGGVLPKESGFILALLLAGCTFGNPPPERPRPPEPEPPACNAQHSWNDYHLPHDALSPVVRSSSSYDVELEAWNALDTPLQLRDSGSGFPIEVSDGGNENSGWLGLASVTVGPEGHITSGRVTMNRAILSRYSPAVAAHVLCQEVGHVLGLDHQRDVLDSCMQDCVGKRGAEWLACLEHPDGVTPNAHDAEELRDKYAHAVDPDNPPPKPPEGCEGATQVILHAFPVEGAGDHP